MKAKKEVSKKEVAPQKNRKDRGGEREEGSPSKKGSPKEGSFPAEGSPITTFSKYDLSGNEVGKLSLDLSFQALQGHSQMIKDYLIALRANARQWSANTKGRSEVAHTTKKPHRQKGTGGARQGNLVTPQFRGGGIVFGPKPKFDQHVRINRKERRKAIGVLLAEKAKENKLIVMTDAVFSDALKSPKTKQVADFLKKHGLFGRKVLFVGEGTYEKRANESEKIKVSLPTDRHAVFKLSLRNIPNVSYSLASNLNGYEIAASRAIIFTESALEEIREILI